MYRQFDSPAGRRFLALIREGSGLKPSARAVGVNKETGYRWLRDEYFRLRGEGLSHAAAQAGLGFFSDRAREWNERLGPPEPRERKLKANRRLRTLVHRKLNRNWSPEQICGWLALRFPAEPGLRLCPETI